MTTTDRDDTSSMLVRTSRPRSGRRTTAAALLALATLAGCASGSEGGERDSAETTAATTGTTAPVDRAGSPDRRLVAVGADGHRLAFECRGAGAPTIVLEAGTDSSGIDGFPEAFLEPLAASHRTCTYDRLGTSAERGCAPADLCSDEPTADRRTIDDVVGDLEEMLSVAAVPGPYLLVGSSGGGLVVARFAQLNPGDTAGLVLLDAGVPNPNLGDEFPGEAAWDNVEHVDWVDAERQLATLPAPTASFPLLVVVAEDGETPDQSFWLQLTTAGTQVTLPGGHDLHEDHPAATAAAILDAMTP
jgi:pimeloyl-ACP methyl ester carboxylesterase